MLSLLFRFWCFLSLLCTCQASDAAQLCSSKLLFQLRWSFVLVACCGAAAPPKRKTCVDELSFAFYLAGLALGSVMVGIGNSCSAATLVSGYAGFRPWLLAAGAPRQANAKNARRSSIYARFCVISGVWPRRALSWPESEIAVPATLVSGIRCFLRACCSVCDDERSPETTPRDLYLDIVCLYIYI